MYGVIKDASHTNFFEKKTGLLKHRADIATQVRDNFFPNNEIFL